MAVETMQEAWARVNHLTNAKCGICHQVKKELVSSCGFCGAELEPAMCKTCWSTYHSQFCLEDVPEMSESHDREQQEANWR